MSPPSVEALEILSPFFAPCARFLSRARVAWRKKCCGAPERLTSGAHFAVSTHSDISQRVIFTLFLEKARIKGKSVSWRGLPRKRNM